MLVVAGLGWMGGGVGPRRVPARVRTLSSAVFSTFGQAQPERRCRLLGQRHTRTHSSNLPPPPAVADLTRSCFYWVSQSIKERCRTTRHFLVAADLLPLSRCHVQTQVFVKHTASTSGPVNLCRPENILQAYRDRWMFCDTAHRLELIPLRLAPQAGPWLAIDIHEMI